MVSAYRQNLGALADWSCPDLLFTSIFSNRFILLTCLEISWFSEPMQLHQNINYRQTQNTISNICPTSILSIDRFLWTLKLKKYWCSLWYKSYFESFMITRWHQRPENIDEQLEFHKSQSISTILYYTTVIILFLLDKTIYHKVTP